jgi:hypothetical protein
MRTRKNEERRKGGKDSEGRSEEVGRVGLKNERRIEKVEVRNWRREGMRKGQKDRQGRSEEVGKSKNEEIRK